ncbi:hypothetical protein CL684_02070 [Candidatus Campbellbacteria bacterium]|nr:hypothetical protein [Candidatus Campbellbacteria bacterium]|tara:strand:- start:511 stop:2340 length:1830 start_codon:yes stop_codon:yes gene_type:complete
MKKVYKAQEIRKLLKELNLRFAVLHKRHEEYFWKVAMGNEDFKEKMNTALAERNDFFGNNELQKKVKDMLPSATDELKERLMAWKRFFKMNTVPTEAKELRNEIAQLESDIESLREHHEFGYKDPKTKKFVSVTKSGLMAKMRTDESAAHRKAYFKGLENGAKIGLKEYVKLIDKRNTFAKQMGYDDFFDYKIQHEDKMTKEELFKHFDEIYKATKGSFKQLRALAKKKKNLQKPWNFAYMMSADIKKEEEPYFPFERALPYWGRSLHDMGIGFAKGRLTLDLVARPEKFSNPFCQWPDVVRYSGKRRIPGSARFTADLVPNTLGSGKRAMRVMFHEGGHASHLLNSTETEACNNSEYLPMTSAWAETQSMFMDTMFNSAEWHSRYAHNSKGEYYPLNLHKKKFESEEHTYGLRMMSIIAMSEFERKIYEMKKPTVAKITTLAKKISKKYFDYSEDSHWPLYVSHLFVFEWSCSYYGYGLAQMAVEQMRSHYYQEFGSIVGNKEVGKELTKLWNMGARHTFKDFVKIATGKKISTTALIKEFTKTPSERYKEAVQRIDAIKDLPRPKKKINLKGYITMVHGERKICSNMRDYAGMVSRYHEWITTYKNT